MKRTRTLTIRFDNKSYTPNCFITIANEVCNLMNENALEEKKYSLICFFKGFRQKEIDNEAQIKVKCNKSAFLIFCKIFLDKTKNSVLKANF